ncbi:MAG TPA: hypothetical protein VF791_15450 [Pyrinomonadaceae bacterium]
MRQEDVAQYQSKVTDDNGLPRSRVPCPLLNALKAQPGDYVVFRLAGSNEAIMRVSRARRRSGVGESRKARSGSKRR